MFSYPSFEDVVDDLGDKLTGALAKSVAASRGDWDEFRQLHPDWATESSERGRANFIHDRMWAHLVGLLDDADGVEMHEFGVTRELMVGLNYRIRIKRHRAGAVASYPTETALSFLAQPEEAFQGMQLVHLIAGYEWIEGSHDVGPAVLSLRDGTDKLLWIKELDEPTDLGEAGDVTPIDPSTEGPVPPVISLPGDDVASEEADES